MSHTQFKNLRGELINDHNLARYTSWRVGGNAQQFYRPSDLTDLKNFLSQLPEEEPLTWLGLGSNVLIRDGGIAGTVVLTLNGLNQLQAIDPQTLRVEAGVTCAKLSKFCVKSGFEEGAFFAGIPGTVGGALAMNAGAFGGETWRQVVAVETINRSGQMRTRPVDDFSVRYRQVEGLHDEFFVAGHFRFHTGDPRRAKEMISQLIKKRNVTQPIGKYSCGSVFRNPKADYAARLIESAGLKGASVGDAEVSSKHANFILNKGNATASDIESLINYIEEEVRNKKGVQLIREVHIIGREEIPTK